MSAPFCPGDVTLAQIQVGIWSWHLSSAEFKTKTSPRCEPFCPGDIALAQISGWCRGMVSWRCSPAEFKTSPWGGWRHRLASHSFSSFFFLAQYTVGYYSDDRPKKQVLPRFNQSLGLILHQFKISSLNLCRTAT